MEINPSELTRRQKFTLPFLLFLAAGFLLYYGVTKPSEVLLILGMACVQLSAVLFSMVIIPILRPVWGMVLGSFSGLIFSFTAFILGTCALWLSVKRAYSLVCISGYAFVLLGALSMILLIRLLISAKSRFGWYKEFIEGCLNAGEYGWCIAACKEALTLISVRSGKIVPFLIEEINDQKAALPNQMGVCYFRRGEYRSAIQEYTKAIELCPSGRTLRGVSGYKLAIAYGNRAEAYIALGNYQAAIADCEDALKVDSNDEYAKNLKAEAKIKNALEIDPSNKYAKDLRFSEATLKGARVALRNLGPFNNDKVPALMALMKDEDERVRWVTNEILGDIGPDAKDAVSLLTESLMKDPHGYVRGSAAVALGQIRQLTHQVIAALTQSLQDSDSFVRGAAANALGEMGPASKSALQTLRALQDGDPDYRVREFARKAIMRISDR